MSQPVPFLFGDRAGPLTGIERFQLDADLAFVGSGFINLANYVVGDNVHDDTAGLNIAIAIAMLTHSRLIVPALPVGGAIRTTAPIPMSRGFYMEGAGVSPFEGGVGTRGAGSWFHFDHPGIGFVVGDGVTATQGFYFDAIGTFRSQPAPGPGWAPGAFDYDFQINNVDATLIDVCCLNPTKLLHQINGNAGRLNTIRLRGQPLQVGIFVDASFDTNHLVSTHFWPFWSVDSNVKAYMQANCQPLLLARCDNPVITDYFCIWAQRGIQFTASSSGITSRACITGFGCDAPGDVGVFFDSTAVGASAQLSNGYVAGDGVTMNSGYNVQAAGVSLQIANSRCTTAQQQAIVCQGSGSIIELSGIKCEDWNQFNGGASLFPMMAAAAGGRITVAGEIVHTGGLGGPVCNDFSAISSLEWNTAFVPVVTATAGTPTSPAATMRFRHEYQLVTFTATVTIGAIGTGSGALVFTLPINAAAGDTWSVVGRDNAITGKTVQGQISAGVCTFEFYDNTYPGNTGASITLSGSFRTAA